VQPVAEIGRLAREHEVLLLVDAAQTAGVMPIDVQGHEHRSLGVSPAINRYFGPTGTGALYVGPRAKLRAWREGRDRRRLGQRDAAEKSFPTTSKGGTPNVLGVAGLIAGIQYGRTERAGGDPSARGGNWSRRLWRRLDELEGITVYGHRDHGRAGRAR